MATILYEGLPHDAPDGGIWWRLVEKYKVTVMFSAPTAVRVLKKHDPELLKQYDLSQPSRAVPGRRAAGRADRPLDRRGLGMPIIDNYWQTESGWPILTVANGVERSAQQVRQPGCSDVWLQRQPDRRSDRRGTRPAPARRACVAIEGPLPPGCMQTVWRDDARFVDTYWKSIAGTRSTSTFDWGIRDEDGYYYILGRTDDVINVAGHRLGTREIEESISSHPDIAEVAVVGVADALQGPGRDRLRGAEGRRALRRSRGGAGARRRGHEAVDETWARWLVRRACASSRAAEDPLAASCCAARSRRSARAAIPAT